MTGDLVTGGRYSLAGDRGRAVILNYFATWCAPCQIETPQLDAFAKTVDRSKVDVVAVDVKDISQDAAMSWLREKRVSLPVVWDSPDRTALELGDVPLFVLPATVVIDASGRIAAVYFSRVTPDDLRRALTALG